MKRTLMTPVSLSLWSKRS